MENNIDNIIARHPVGMEKTDKGIYTVTFTEGDPITGLSLDASNRMKLQHVVKSNANPLIDRSDQNNAPEKVDDDFDEEEYLSSLLTLDGYSFRDITPISPDIKFYWVADFELGRKKKEGYVFAEQSDIEDIGVLAGSTKVGDSYSDEGVITYNEHTLMKISKRKAELIDKAAAMKSRMNVKGTLSKYTSKGIDNKGTKVEHIET